MRIIMQNTELMLFNRVHGYLSVATGLRVRPILGIRQVNSWFPIGSG